MIEYANETVIKALKQYDMLLKSLKFITDLKQRQDVGEQMTKIIQRVLDITKTIYTDKYMKVYNKSTFLMDEERTKLLELIHLVNERRNYINNQINNNYEITSINIDSGPVLGEEELDSFKERVKIIEKYKNNIKQDEILRDELNQLEISIRKANNKLGSNKVLNRQLESKMIRILDNAFEKLSLYELKEREKEIDLAYTELGYSLEKAKENAKIARNDCTQDIIIECDNMLSAITLEYERYKEKKLILRLLEIYNNPTLNYDELLNKREEMNSILSGIVGSDLYKEVGEELNKQYATIKLEKQDSATLKSLSEEKRIKLSALEDIKKENDSEEFKNILADLLENERKHDEELLLIKKKEEEKQRLIELEKEKKRREEIIRRQKALEEERNKEIEERTKRLLNEKKTSVLSSTKDKPIEEEEKKENFAKSVEELKQKRKVEEGIPVIKNDNYNSNVISVEKVSRDEEVFPKVKLDKKEDIFPAFPSIDKDSFFDENELDDLNKDLDDNGNNKWF